MVPLPLAPGPSTAIRIRSGATFSLSECSVKRRALTGLLAYGKAPAARCGASSGTPPAPTKTGVILTMVKPEWGAKRTCPKCSTRFYDLGKDNPVHCIECHNEWVPEPVLKSKQPVAFEPRAGRQGAGRGGRPRSRGAGDRRGPGAVGRRRGRSRDRRRRSRGRDRGGRGRGLSQPFAGGISSFQWNEVRLKARDDGAVAQLGERRNGIAKVRGSIPLGSTILHILNVLTLQQLSRHLRLNHRF